MLCYRFLFLVCCSLRVVCCSFIVVCCLLFRVRCSVSVCLFLLFVDRCWHFCDRMSTVGCDSLSVVRVACSLFVVRRVLFACCVCVVCSFAFWLLFGVCGLLLFVFSRLSCVYR